MAIYIEIRKIAEDSGSAEYTYRSIESELGKLKVDKNSGEVTLIESASNDKELRMYHRAAHKIKKHWLNGELPVATCWAS